MCGIAGIVDLRERAVDRALVERLCARLVHRGPDEEGYYVDGPVGLGQRRLSIIDLSSGQQPMPNEDRKVWVTFNGEIYNFQSLRAGLEAAGHRFATHSDTETILHAYESHGADCVKSFRGMFAFAVWDSVHQTLFAARDRVGKKPFFYAIAGGQFVFASELQSLLEHPAIGREIDHYALDEYLTYGYIPAPRTIFRGVFKLPPAHTLTLALPASGDGVVEPRIERYWQLEYGPKLRISEGDAKLALLELLTEAVRLRMIADVPLGALLSGGVDSSLIVALMSQLSDRPVKTFSIGFDEKEFNELPHARRVAERYGTDHHEFVVRPNALEVIPTLVRHYGEPYADSSAVPSYYVAKLTRQQVTVALNGDGGDESFAGYERYLAGQVAERYRRIPAIVRRGLIEPTMALVPQSLPRRSRLGRARRFFQAASQPAGERYLRWLTFFTPEQKQALYTPGFRDRIGGRDGRDWFLEQFSECAGGDGDPLDAMLATDVQSYLPYDLLVKMDIATMANSLECRSPLLDHEVMEFAAKLPSRLKIHGLTLKYLLKEIAADLLPRENLARRKMGFGVPVGDWMRTELRPFLEENLFSARSTQRGYFEPGEVRRLVDEHVQGAANHTYQLWSLLWLEVWHQEFGL